MALVVMHGLDQRQQRTSLPQRVAVGEALGRDVLKAPRRGFHRHLVVIMRRPSMPRAPALLPTPPPPPATLLCTSNIANVMQSSLRLPTLCCAMNQQMVPLSRHSIGPLVAAAFRSISKSVLQESLTKESTSALPASLLYDSMSEVI